MCQCMYKGWFRWKFYNFFQALFVFQNVSTELIYANLCPVQRYRDSYFNEVDRLLAWGSKFCKSMLRDSFCKARERDNEAVV